MNKESVLDDWRPVLPEYAGVVCYVCGCPYGEAAFGRAVNGDVLYYLRYDGSAFPYCSAHCATEYYTSRSGTRAKSQDDNPPQSP